MKIGFIDQATPGWTAGSTYTQSMVHALRAGGSSAAEIVLLSGDHCSFPQDRCPIPIVRLKSLGEQHLMQSFLEQDLDVLFPVSEPFERLQTVASVGWIPDFQHVFLPELFSVEEILRRDQKFLELARFARMIVVSSEAARKDFTSVFPEYAGKVEAIPFPSLLAYETWWQSRDPESTRQRYCLPARFLLVANQIWRHKNHQVVLEALALLKRKRKPITVVFTGAPSDYRVPRNAHLSRLLQSVSAFDLRENAIFLGEVPYEEVVDLYRRAEAVLQPSRFEGWNTSLQDAKALGKRILASRIPVHQEQAADALFFDPLNPEELAAQLENLTSLDAPSEDYSELSMSGEQEMGARSGARLLETFARLTNMHALGSSCATRPSEESLRKTDEASASPQVLSSIQNGQRANGLANILKSGLMGAYDRLVLPFRFNEQYYRKANPSAAEALAKGEFRAGIEHYQKVGRNLGLAYAQPRRNRRNVSARLEQRDVPVALFLFNRPAYTSLVFSRIREFAPTTLLLIADGPRNETESLLCEKARAVTDQIDWPCEVLRNFSPRNLGCKKRVSSGLGWVFERVEEAIILEDDCLPDPSFFPFCSELLARYRTDEQVMHISGSCFLPQACTSDSYWFSRHSDIWGWATWRRAFRHYDAELNSWRRWRRRLKTKAIWKDRFEREFWSRKLDRTQHGEIDTWDYQWHWTVYRRNGLAIVPRHNLVANLGHGQQGSHTGDECSSLASLPTAPLESKLSHPRRKGCDEFTDQQVLFARYVLSSRPVDNQVPVPVAIDPQHVVVAHDAPTPAQGVGALLCKVMRHDEHWISIRSRDCYLEHQTVVLSFRIDERLTGSSRLGTFKRITSVLGDTPVSAVLAVPFSAQDCLNAAAIHALYDAPLAVWLMDDQNIFTQSIPDALLRELLTRASVRLAICEEMKEAYQEKFGLPFKVQMPVENADDLVLRPLDVPFLKNDKIVGCGNIWCEKTLRRLMELVNGGPVQLDWYGNLGQPRKTISDEELLAHKIHAKGLLPHSALLTRLRQYPFAIVPFPDEDDPNRAWQAKLSFPSKLITLTYAANLPVLYLGAVNHPGARFVRSRGLGVVSSWSQSDYQSACEELQNLATATRIRANAARQAPEFSATNVMPAIWNACKTNGVPELA